MIDLVVYCVLLFDATLVAGLVCDGENDVKVSKFQSIDWHYSGIDW